MDAPIAERAVGVVEEMAEALRMNRLVERPLRRRAQPQVPIHARRRFAVRRLLPGAAGGVCKQPHHADLPHLARLEKLHPGHAMRRDAAVQSHLTTSRPLSRAAFTIALPSSIVWPIGFSTYTCAPDFTAAIVGSACQ